MARAKKTSITYQACLDAIDKLKEKSAGKKGDTELSCTEIPGFHLYISITAKGSVSSVWRVRYPSPAIPGKRPKYRIGKLSRELMPEQAAEKAKWVNEQVDAGRDPQIDEAQAKQEIKNEYADLLDLASITLQQLRDDHYKPWLINQIGEETAIQTLRQYINPPCAFKDRLNTKLSDINEAWVHRWQNDRKKYARDTINRNFAALESMLNTMAKEGVIPVNPIQGVKLREPTPAERKAEALRKERAEAEEKRKRRPLEDFELEGIAKGYLLYLEQMRDTNHWDGKSTYWLEPFISIGYNHGARPGDIRRLEWNVHVDLEAAILSFTPRKTQHHPDPAKVRHAIAPQTLRVLKRWYEQLGSPKTGYVFPTWVTAGTDSKTGHIARGAHNIPFKQILEFGGLDPSSLDFYSFRHNFISQMIMENKSMKTVAILAGHKTTRMIEKNYAHLDSGRAIDALNIIASKPIRISVDRPTQDNP